ncbi:hypothetical protein PInf_013154 [Phytophthora infestans]|nr:hypothetical protein PInf_013154 [Phytophthora infestans]
MQTRMGHSGDEHHCRSNGEEATDAEDPQPERESTQAPAASSGVASTAIGNKWLPTRRDKIERKEGRQDAGDLSKTDGTISDDREEERRVREEGGIDKKTVTIVENAKNSMAVPDERHLGKQEVVALSYQTTISRTILLATMTQARWQSTQ